jgi:hypothetical protein
MPTAEIIRIGKGSTVTETPIAVAAVDGTFLAANANRISLTIWNGSASVVTISTKNPAIAGQGVSMPAASGPHRLTLEDFGPLLQGAWRSIGGGAVTIAVFEETSTAQ